MKEGSSYKWIVLGNIMIGTFMAVLDSTVVNTGLPVIMGTLGADINVAEWVLTGYMLSMASILPAAGWLSERFGYKRSISYPCLSLQPAPSCVEVRPLSKNLFSGG